MVVLAIIMFIVLPTVATRTNVDAVAAPLAPTTTSQDDLYKQAPSTYNFWYIGDTYAKTGCHIIDSGGIAHSVLYSIQKALLGGTYTDYKYKQEVYGIPEFLGTEGTDCDQTRLDEIRKSRGIEKVTDVESYYNYKLNQNSGLYGQLMALNSEILKQRPASGKAYVDQQVYALKSFGSVNAQEGSDNVSFYYPGTGFSLLRPIQGFWGWSVYVTYGFLIILIIFVAFGIILGDKLPGAANITLQTAIPSIAMAMILVPLSYAISGLAIDAVTLGTNAAHEFIMGPGAPARMVYENRETSNLEALGIDYPDLGYYPDDVRVSWFYAWNNFNVKDQSSNLLTEFKLTDNPVFKLIDDVLNWLPLGSINSGETVGGWVGGLLSVIGSVILFFTGARILVKLLKKYLVFIVGPIFSPFVFATVAIPGTGTKNVMMYMKILFSGSLFYIIAYSMMLLSLALASPDFQATVPGADAGLYIPPLLGLDLIVSKIDIGADSGAVSFLFSLLSFAVFLSIPKMLDDVDASLGTNKSMFMPLVASTLLSAQHSLNTGRAFSRAPGMLADQYDKARGRTPGEDDSIRGRTRKRFAGVTASLDATAQSGGVRGAAARVARFGAGGVSRAYGSNTSGAQKPGEASKLEAKIKYNGPDMPGGFISFSDKEIINICQRFYEEGPGGNPVVLRGASIGFKAENMILPSRLDNSTVSIFSVTNADTRSANESAGEKQNTGGRLPFAPGQDIFDITTSSRGSISITLGTDQNDYYRTANGAESAVEMFITINDPVVAFGWNPVTQQLDPTIRANAALTTGKPIMGQKRIFRINGVSTAPLRIALQLTPGNN